MRRRAVLAAGAWLAAPAAQAATAARLVVFGDSYSTANFPFPVWPELLRRWGVVEAVRSYAMAGATAGPSFLASPSRRTFTGQLLAHARDGGSAAGDVTIVYFGYNDLRAGDPRRAAADYASHVRNLVRLGAARPPGRLLLTLIHDRSRNPDRYGVERADVLAWNRAVAQLAASLPHAETIDLLTPFDLVFAEPGRFGLGVVDRALPDAPDALFHDGSHVGRRGQEIIAKVIRWHLARPPGVPGDLAGELAAGRVL